MSSTSPEGPLDRWAVNLNPQGVSLWKLICEDLEVHGNDPLCQGFWAIAVHRLGNWIKGRRSRSVRRVSYLPYLLMTRFVEWTCGITIMHSTRLGRRVRIWHHSGIILNAESIGDGVIIRQNTTLGNARSGGLERPILEDNVELGCGVVVLGRVRIGRGSSIGANAVVTRDIPAGCVAGGIPARILNQASVSSLNREPD